MRKRTAAGLALGALVVAGAVLGYRMRRGEQAHALEGRAARLLHPPLSEASSFQDIRAAEARELLEEAQQFASSPEQLALIEQAEIIRLLQRGDYTAAERRLAHRSDAGDEFSLLRAALALAKKDLAAAERALSRLSAAAGEQPRVALLRSDLARARGQADLALEYAQRGLDHAAQSAALYERRGLAYELLDDVEHARADLERAAALDARGVTALLALGRVLRSAGAMRDAVLAFHAASERSPSEAEAWLGSGVCRAAMGDYVAARVDLERAAELAPARAEPLVGLGDVDVAQGQLENALGRYKAAALLDPTSATARVKLGNALLRKGTIAAAATEFRGAIERRPDLGAAHNGLGVALLEQGDLADAETELKVAASLDPNDAHPMLNLARLYKRRGDSPQLADALAQAEARDPQLRITSSDASTKKH